MIYYKPTVHREGLLPSREGRYPSRPRIDCPNARTICWWRNLLGVTYFYLIRGDKLSEYNMTAPHDTVFDPL